MSCQVPPKKRFKRDYIDLVDLIYSYFEKDYDKLEDDYIDRSYLQVSFYGEDVEQDGEFSHRDLLYTVEVEKSGWSSDEGQINDELAFFYTVEHIKEQLDDSGDLLITKHLPLEGMSEIKQKILEFVQSRDVYTVYYSGEMCGEELKTRFWRLNSLR